MSKASRARRRKTVRKARTTRNRAWYAVIGVIVLVGVALVVDARRSGSAVGPQPGRDHWHAALGVYDCNHWLGDSSGKGIWVWPATTSEGLPGRVGSDQYAGLHSHDDGIIHMEPVSSDESGNNATVGRYFQFGGWQLSSGGYSFLGTTVRNGGLCNGEPGVLRWATAKFDGNPNAPQQFTERVGNPGKWKLNDGDIVIIAFVPKSVSPTTLGNPPSLVNLPGALGREGQNAPTTTAPG